ncbi:thin pilus adhesin subunit AcuG [Acinetobacter baumannii]|uniref:thin pilus adhesin subunit AcuG n=1 Tax=Acinetobacter baumannii TaxID=470 RepID=UPI002446C674|nr:thin pilus adhesin subunit AcuG [Acinetobacter baumannii]MDH2640518.1 thin pilus adhesin subunit AcuG [Acinetobacter baumannii]
MYKKIVLALICLLFFVSKSHAVCTTRTNPVNFAANLTKAHSDNAFLQLVSQTIAASSSQPIDSCSGSGPSTFTMNGVTDLTTNSTIFKDGYTYYQIPSAKITPSTASANIKVYLAFSIKDNQDAATEFWINSATTSYDFYTGTSDTRGLRLQNVRLLVSGLGNTAGTYTISNLKLGNFSAKGSTSTTATTSIVLTGTTFQITKSTCVINNGAVINVTLPIVTSSSFTAAGQTVGDTPFTVSVSGCSLDDTNKTLVALLTDNNNASGSNTSGLLKNTYSTNVSVQITDSAGSALPIAPKNIDNSSSFFSFGTIGSGGTVSKAFKARYYSNVAAVPATLVQAQATITLIYN